MEIECKYYFDELEEQYACKVSTVNITSPQTEIKTFKGEHEADKDESSVARIVFEDTIVAFFPMGIINAFPNVTILNITKCGLRAISREDLSEFENLVEFHADFNKLKTLPSDLFIGKPKLQTISFSYNQLEFVSSLLLKPLLKNPLIWVDFSGNVCINLYYCHGHIDDGCDSVEELMDKIDEPSEGRIGFTDRAFDDNLRSYSAELWTSGRFSDFTIIGSGLSTEGETVKEEIKEFRVHKNILGLQSSFFAALFESDMEDSKAGQLEIFDFSANAVEQFLGFLYTGKVPDDVNAMEIFAMAAKYDVPDLKKHSEKTISKHLTVENALEVFNLGHLYSSCSIKEKAFKFIKEMFPGKCLEDVLMDDPEGLKELIDVENIRKMKTKEADDELAAATMAHSAKVQEYTEMFNLVWMKVSKKKTDK